MPLMVQNNARNTTLFALPGGKQPIIWAGTGDPMGDDVQRVPDDLANDIDFLRSLDQGLLTVIDGDDPDVLSKLQRSSTAFASRQEANAAKAEAMMDRKQDRDLIAVACLGPDGRGNDGGCGQQVLQRSSEIKGSDPKPPLCDRHKALAPQFYITQDGSKGEGATEGRAGVITRTWKRVQMTAPARGLG